MINFTIFSHVLVSNRTGCPTHRMKFSIDNRYNLTYGYLVKKGVVCVNL